jgi:phage-related protein
MKRLPAHFYRTAGGTQPVKDWLLSLAADDRRIVGADIATVEFGWPIGMPVCRPLKSNLYEVRSTIRDGRVEARVYFAILSGHAVLLHGTTGKDTQQQDIDLARTRLADFRKRTLQ